MPSDRPTRVTGIARTLALVSTDAAALLLSGLAAYLIWAVTVRDEPIAEWLRMAPLVPLFTLSYAFGGLYPGFGVSAIELIRVTARQTSLVFLVIVGSVYVLRLPGDYSRGTLALWWAMAIMAVPLARASLSLVSASRSWWREPVLLIGGATKFDTVVESLSRARHVGYRPVAVVLTGGSAGSLDQWHGLPVVPESATAAAARHFGARTVLVLADTPRHERWAAELSEHVRHVVAVHALEDRYIEPAAIRYLGSSIGIEVQNRLLMRRNRLLKRSIDIALGSVFLLLSLPIVAVAAVAIVLRDSGPWWHAQTREGRGGRRFRMWKLRTMYQDADERLAAHLTADVRAREEWERGFKLTRDPRVLSGVGTFLRRWSLDECPQYWNVIRGEMSLVGPRALPHYHLEAFDQSFRTLRSRVRPGMTGMWQVMSRGADAIDAQEALDSYYIYNWSIWMDVFILGRTVLAVIGGRGAR